VINEAVCEGCGDCGVQSNCPSVEPLETEFGRKRKINQSFCNKDFTCLTGFCPSFVTVEGGSLRNPVNRKAGGNVEAPQLGELPQPSQPALDVPYDIIVTGVGGTGVITIGQILAMAGHLEGKACSVLDQTGAAQKGGAVMSHVRLAAAGGALYATRVGMGAAALVLGCDLIVTATRDALLRMGEGKTRGVVNLEQTPTMAFMKNPDWQFPGAKARQDIGVACGDGVEFVEATRFALALTGDAIATNMLLVGYAWQKGWIPLGEAALMRAIELNGASVDFNKSAFAWGRLAGHDLSALRQTVVNATGAKVVEFKRSPTLDELVAARVEYLTGYQDAAYGARYRAFVDRVRGAEVAALPQAKSTRLAEAVARSLFKLMAYKDEYEVARLHSASAFKDRLGSLFEGPFRVTYHLAPPLFAKRDGQGHPIKKEYGPWMGWAMGLLARLRFLRGTPLDVFGKTPERRGERALIAQYMDTLDSLMPRLTAENIEIASEIADVPQGIRGYGHIKQKSLQAAGVRREELLREFERVCATPRELKRA
jgi:indolepyruvate ferredoxin oxidoreductase